MTDHRKHHLSEDSSLPADGTKLAGRILKGVGGNYQVLLDSGVEITAKPRGILRKDNSVPYPGDFVDVSFTSDEVTQYNIDHIHERTSFLIRRPLQTWTPLSSPALPRSRNRTASYWIN